MAFAVPAQSLTTEGKLETQKLRRELCVHSASLIGVPWGRFDLETALKPLTAGIGAICLCLHPERT